MSKRGICEKMERTYESSSTFKIQYPKVPNETSDPLARLTFRIGMLLMIGAEIVVMTRRTDAARSKKVPTWWKIPVLAIVTFVVVLSM